MKINLENNQDLGASAYSKTVHIHAINKPKQKFREYNIPLILCAVVRSF